MTIKLFTRRIKGTPARREYYGCISVHHPSVPGWAWGLLFNPYALWVGSHYSKHHKRYCINLIPGLTLWVTKRGGQEP